LVVASMISQLEVIKISIFLIDFMFLSSNIINNGYLCILCIPTKEQQLLGLLKAFQTPCHQITSA
jgi:hypothetical protein